MNGGIMHLAQTLEQDLLQALPWQRKTQRKKLALLVATMIEVRSANTMELAAALPIETERIDMRYQWISRFLANPNVKVSDVMTPFVKQLILRYISENQVVVLSIDQSKVSDSLQLLMVSIRWGERALPVAWCVKDTKGNIPFYEQKSLLDVVRGYLPVNTSIVLMGDRFYGTPDLIAYCKRWGWDYRLRLKNNIWLYNGLEEGKTGSIAARGEQFFENITITHKRERTNIAIIHDDDHPEPWIIAMGKTPTAYRALDYGMRWSIEAMFSDFKSRGFGLEDSQLIYSDRLERLILIMALAMMWAVFSGFSDFLKNPLPYEKKASKKASRSLMSYFTRGLRFLLRCAQRFISPPSILMPAMPP